MRIRRCLVTVMPPLQTCANEHNNETRSWRRIWKLIDPVRRTSGGSVRPAIACATLLLHLSGLRPMRSLEVGSYQTHKLSVWTLTDPIWSTGDWLVSVFGVQIKSHVHPGRHGGAVVSPVILVIRSMLWVLSRYSRLPPTSKSMHGEVCTSCDHHVNIMYVHCHCHCLTPLVGDRFSNPVQFPRVKTHGHLQTHTHTRCTVPQ